VNNPLIVALAITLAGMGLLFLALAFFYGLLTLISSALQEGARRDAPTETVDQGAPDRPAPPAELMLQAAAIAVALARAEAEGGPGPAGAGRAAQPLSSWWILHQGHRTAAGSSPWRTL
jgi:Na+-transporting methylmalonyl-CoA/oxaloacetate decarboxylase gamma subunit